MCVVIRARSATISDRGTLLICISFRWTAANLALGWPRACFFSIFPNVFFFGEVLRDLQLEKIYSGEILISSPGGASASGRAPSPSRSPASPRRSAGPLQGHRASALATASPAPWRTRRTLGRSAISESLTRRSVFRKGSCLKTRHSRVTVKYA